ncbi:fructosamine kinase family protein [Streptomyces sp. MP131-18]|uniref:fructosamine kinase family protein n=1 Tax=Streptomyces sp. MP131-18 TaxID=1857892 RepID=UPI00097C8F62|nr:fructosamine kinase family protein [Streptomyces sp. MP131-18]ONK13569.1 Fructosamine-3-kinase [Streptomyces sp. MP131-18]
MTGAGPALRAALRAAGVDASGADARPLTGGVVSEVWLLTWPDGARLVAKHAAGAPPGLYPAEAAGLRALADDGGLTVPEVRHAGDRLLLMQAMAAKDPARRPAFWAEAGRALARLHTVRGPRHGWYRDGWLGLLPQRNAWADDGYEFYATRRILRYLPEPRAVAALTAADRAAIERICERLPAFVPPTPAVLTHGDLWHANMVATAEGAPAFIDPAVSFTWPDVDLSMFHASAAPADADRFFGAYAELRPLGDGWRDRMEVLFLRELLSTVAHEDDCAGALAHLRRITARYG